MTGGKGGVGKTTSPSISPPTLAARGKQVCCSTATWASRTSTCCSGLTPRLTLADVLAGKCSLEEIVARRAAGFQGGAGRVRHRAARRARHAHASGPGAGLRRPHRQARRDGRRHRAGIAGSVLQFSQAAQQVLVVICDEPASLTDAYALIKVLSRDHGVTQIPRAREQVARPRHGPGAVPALRTGRHPVPRRGARLRRRDPRRRVPAPLDP